MMKKVLVNTVTGILENIILVDPDNMPEVAQGYRMEDDIGGCIGDLWFNGEWTAPEPVDLAPKARSERDGLLSSSDWTQVADAPVDQAAWASYRVLLRNVPQQAGFPHTVAWPTKPEGE